MLRKIILVLAIFVTVNGFASGEHADKEFIQGSGFDLVHVNHILVGTFNLIPIWAEKECGSHIRGQYKLGEEIATFEVIINENKKIEGTFNEKVITFKNFDRPNMNIILTDGTNNIPVHIAYDDVVDGHLQQINFTFANGEKNFDIHLDGEGCMGSAIFYSIFFYGMSSL